MVLRCHYTPHTHKCIKMFRFEVEISRIKKSGRAVSKKYKLAKWSNNSNRVGFNFIKNVLKSEIIYPLKQ